MARITYTGRETRQDGTIGWHGHLFEPNKAVEVDDERDADLIAAARANSAFFEVSGGDKPTADDKDEPDERIGAYTVKRGFQGKYAVMKGDDTIAEGLTKVEAERHAEEWNAADGSAKA